MIDTREELINALSEAAEIEHGLLVQYLFAAFSMKRRVDEGITPVQQARMIEWERTVLQVGHEEMSHLATVCNLLSAIGGAPQFSHPNFPQPARAYYPFDFQLERFNDAALHRFVVFEIPEGEPPPPPPVVEAGLLFTSAAPDPLVYNHVGELYGEIARGFETIPEAELFIGPKPLQDDTWSRGFDVQQVTDRASARRAILHIVEEGEGAPGNREGSHYDRFRDIRAALQLARDADPSFDPARPVVLNPQTREHRDTAGPGTLIENEMTRELAEVFNDVYTSMLLMLIQYYSYGGETAEERVMLRDSSRRLMSAVIRPLAEILTELPATADPSGGNAGPGFEIYSGLRVAPHRANRWSVLLERFRGSAQDAASFSRYTRDYPVLARLERITYALQGTLKNLASVAREVV